MISPWADSPSLLAQNEPSPSRRTPQFKGGVLKEAELDQGNYQQDEGRKTKPSKRMIFAPPGLLVLNFRYE